MECGGPGGLCFSHPSSVSQGWVGTGPHCCPPGPWKLVEFVTLQECPVQGGLLLACLSSSKSWALGWVESVSLGGRMAGTLEQGRGQRQDRAQLSLVDAGDREAQPSSEASTCNTSMAFFSFLLLQKNHSEAECFKRPAGQNAAEASCPELLGFLPLGMLLAGVLTQANLLVFLAPISPLIFFSSAHSSEGIQSCKEEGLAGSENRDGARSSPIPPTQRSAAWGSGLLLPASLPVFPTGVRQVVDQGGGPAFVRERCNTPRSQAPRVEASFWLL